jgi:hypothetical protein
LRSDNGTEFVNKKMDNMCALNGIVHQKTVPYSPQQNGVAERMNRTIMEKVRSMLYYKGISTMWWAEAVSTSVYLINRSTTSRNSSMTSYELAFKVKPRLDHLRVFGSVGYAHVDKAKRTKLEPKSFKCMFLGYAENAKGYRVYDLESNKMKVTRSMKLDEREVDGIYDTRRRRARQSSIRRRTPMMSCSTSRSSNPLLMRRWDRCKRLTRKTRRCPRPSRTTR